MKARAVKMGDHDGLAFECPGCGCEHVVKTTGPGAWTFNGDFEAPTLSPSVLVRSGHFIPDYRGDCWCSFEERYGRPSPFKCRVCHSFVREGRIEFLNDCTHELAGQTVPLPEVEL